MSCIVHHKERAPASMLPFVTALERDGTCDWTIPPSGGVRTRAMQAALFAEGRARNSDGQWHIVDQSQVVTYAEHAENAPHCHAGAIDLLPVRSHLANGGVGSVYLGTEDDPVVRREGLQLLAELAVIARRNGYVTGADFPHPDLDHVEDPRWRELPIVEVSPSPADVG